MFREEIRVTGNGDVIRLNQFTDAQQALGALQAAARSEWPDTPLDEIERFGSLESPEGLRLAGPVEDAEDEDEGREEYPVLVSFLLIYEAPE